MTEPCVSLYHRHRFPAEIIAEGLQYAQAGNIDSNLHDQPLVARPYIQQLMTAISRLASMFELIARACFDFQPILRCQGIVLDQTFFITRNDDDLFPLILLEKSTPSHIITTLDHEYKVHLFSSVDQEKRYRKTKLSPENNTLSIGV